MFNRTGAYRTQQWTTTFADVAGHRLIDIAEGKDSPSVIDWLEKRPQTWLEAIEVGTLDMASSYRSIYHQVLPQAVLVVDPFYADVLVMPMSVGKGLQGREGAVARSA